MNKQQARKQTVERFTNLIDGNVRSNASVQSIIDYYESLIQDKKIMVVTPISEFDMNFIEEENNEFVNEEENDY